MTKKTNSKKEESEKAGFSAGFLWGVAHSSHQVEGNNRNNDWWRWERQGGSKDSSGRACDYWNLYAQDNQLAADLGCNALRLSLEWSRIEPKEGEFSAEALEHYRKILLDLKEKKLQRAVTLWHWTLPLWLVEKYGGWHQKETVDLFVRFGEKVIEKLGSEIEFFITLNEPNVVLGLGYLRGIFPPGKKSIFQFWRARKNMLCAHQKLYDKIKKLRSDLPTGITQYCANWDYSGKSLLLKFLFQKAEDWYNWSFQKKIAPRQDFIGFNYYRTIGVGLRFPWKDLKKDGLSNDLGWGFYPEGLKKIALRARKNFSLPTYVFENGLADSQDRLRGRFLKEHLAALAEANRQGGDVRGYFHWSLMDNFEWAHGYWPKFGLVEVDFETMERRPRPSFQVYQTIIRKNQS